MRENRIEKSLIQSNGNATRSDEVAPVVSEYHNDTEEATVRSSSEDNNKDNNNNSNQTTPRLNRLVQFFLSSKQAQQAKRNLTSTLEGETTTKQILNPSSLSDTQLLNPLENVRKSFFGQHREVDDETMAEPVLSVAAHYAPKVSYEGVQLFTDTNKKSLTTRQKAKLSAATPYAPKNKKDEKKKDDLKKKDNLDKKDEPKKEDVNKKDDLKNTDLMKIEEKSEKKSVDKNTLKEESSASSKTVQDSSNQTTEYLNKISKEMTGTAVELTPIVPESSTTPVASSESPAPNIAKIVPDAAPAKESKKKNATKAVSNTTAASHTNADTLTPLPMNKTTILVKALAKPFIFPYGKAMAKYDTPCVRRCLDDGTVLGMCVRSCDLTPFRRHQVNFYSQVLIVDVKGFPVKWNNE